MCQEVGVFFFFFGDSICDVAPCLFSPLCSLSPPRTHLDRPPPARSERDGRRRRSSRRDRAAAGEPAGAQGEMVARTVIERRRRRCDERPPRSRRRTSSPRARARGRRPADSSRSKRVHSLRGRCAAGRRRGSGVARDGGEKSESSCDRASELRAPSLEDAFLNKDLVAEKRLDIHRTKLHTLFSSPL